MDCARLHIESFATPSLDLFILFTPPLWTPLPALRGEDGLWDVSPSSSHGAHTWLNCFPSHQHLSRGFGFCCIRKPDLLSLEYKSAIIHTANIHNSQMNEHGRLNSNKTLLIDTEIWISYNGSWNIILLWIVFLQWFQNAKFILSSQATQKTGPELAHKSHFVNPCCKCFWWKSWLIYRTFSPMDLLLEVDAENFKLHDFNRLYYRSLWWVILCELGHPDIWSNTSLRIAVNVFFRWDEYLNQ